MHFLTFLSLALFTTLQWASAATPADFTRQGAQGVNLWKLKQLQNAKTSVEAQAQEAVLAEEFPAQYFTQPLDHFNPTGFTFKQRYWVNKRHYKPGTGAPVFVLDGGETSGAGRIPFLDKGIVDLLPSVTGGVGIVLEHRYYGESIAVQNLSTDALRWLTNEQAAADSANFMRTVKLAGIHEDLTAPNTPWIYYGGSYAGARAAHMRVLYPEITFGAIASSAVTHAALSNWEYMETIRLSAEHNCSRNLQHGIESIDEIIEKKTHLPALQALFGLDNVTHADDFAAVLNAPFGSWQSKNWDPAVGSTEFDDFCGAVNSPPTGQNLDIHAVPYGTGARSVKTPAGPLDFSLINYAEYIRKNVAEECDFSMTQDECFGTYNDAAFQNTGLDQEWRLWLFQVCTQWGYFTTAPPNPTHPRIISKLMTLPYLQKICKQAYKPGKHFSIPSYPNVTAVNELGDFGIAADRLAFIDGEVDPWRPDTPHSIQYAQDREDTILRPFKIIPGGVHHWDENGLVNKTAEPADIKKVHDEMVVFVLAWLKDFKRPV
ncbi:peptidase S28 [Pterulicium gracile]|uniref:Peptidase S28 n=1 Tax=Pterulicium gracile TaxID=1884261 RepID=A0A5C3QML4_9AGAR|nr:peptidase S28 [Pterula gracilis]